MANQLNGLVGRVFANGSGDWHLISGQVIPKTFKKWYLIPPYLTLSIIRYVSRVKRSNPGKGLAPSPTPRHSSYWKGNFWVALNYNRQLLLPALLNWMDLSVLWLMALPPSIKYYWNSLRNILYIVYIVWTDTEKYCWIHNLCQLNWTVVSLLS